MLGDGATAEGFGASGLAGAGGGEAGLAIGGGGGGAADLTTGGAVGVGGAAGGDDAAGASAALNKPMRCWPHFSQRNGVVGRLTWEPQFVHSNRFIYLAATLALV